MKKEKLIGIYIWTNKINGKVYIGSSDNIRKRWMQHIATAKNGSNYKFHEAIREFGPENFDKEILELTDKNALGKKELLWIEKYDSIRTGYNVATGYNSISSNPNFESIKKNLSEKASKRRWIKKGRIQKSVYPDEVDFYISDGWELGRLSFSEDHINQIRQSVTGFKHTDEAREKCKTFLGRSHSEKTRNGMSSKLMGRYSLKWYIEEYGKKQGIEKYSLHQKNNSKSKLGRIWIHKNGETKQIDKIHYEKFISDGWNKGRK